MDQTRIWVIGSTQLKGPGDVNSVNAIQDGYTLTPLSRFGTDSTPPAPATKDTTVDTHAVPTGNGLPVASGQGFEVIWRLMAPQPGAIDGILSGSGWQPPSLGPVT